MRIYVNEIGVNTRNFINSALEIIREFFLQEFVRISMHLIKMINIR